MPRKRRLVCSRQRPGEPLHPGPFSRDLGLCAHCSSKAKAGKREQKQEAGRQSLGNRDCGKRKRDAGRAGGIACGPTKRRCGVKNGRCKLDLDRCATWKPMPILFESFLRLLGLLHQRRMAAAPRPWLKATSPDMKIPADMVPSVVEVLTESKFGHPDRFQDRVSQEILTSMRKAITLERSVATLTCLA